MELPLYTLLFVNALVDGATIFYGGMPFMAVWGGFLAVLGRTRVSDDKPPGARNEFTNGCNARLGKQKVLPMLSTTYV
jgi:hypothetical protein